MNYIKYTKKLLNLNQGQENKINIFIKELAIHNNNTNLVGKSTLLNPWKNHVLDCVQISNLIKNRKSSILDMGSGAGFPGMLLAIIGYNNVTLVDSNGKKIKFLKHISEKLNIGVNIFYKRIEEIQNKKYQFLVSRALANLDQLLTYSHKFLSRDTVLIFLKGKSVNYEIEKAKNNWLFDIRLKQSLSDERGKVLIIKNLTQIK